MTERKIKRYGFIICVLVYILFSLVFLKLFPKYFQQSILLSRGIFFLDVSYSKMIVSCIIFLLILIFIFVGFNKGRKSASDYFVLLLFLLGYIPESILFFAMNLSIEYFFSLNLFWLVFISTLFLTRRWFSNRRLYIGNEKQRYILLVVMIVFFTLTVFYIFGRYGSFNFNFSFNIDEIYELRINARQYNIGKIFDLLRNNAMYIVFPLMILVLFAQKKYGLSFFILLLQAMLYSIDNQKAAFFLVIVSIGIFFFLKNDIFFKFPKYILGLSVFQLLFFNTSLGMFLLRNFFERIVFLPAILGANYFTFFSSNPKIVPFVSFFQKLGMYSHYPYDEGISYMMGELLFFNKNISANTGGFGMAYSYGAVGMILIAVLYAVLISFFDVYTSHLSEKVYMCILLIQVFVILNVSIFVVLSSYGLLLALVLLAMINDNSNLKELSVENE
ncbi:hypothetical protein ACYSNW_16065 [Enterococcus sp. LJL99]